MGGEPVVAAKLTHDAAIAPDASRIRRASSGGRLVPRLAAAYVAGWCALLTGALACALLPGARWLAHATFGLALGARLHPAGAPSVAGALALLANNGRAAAWPLLPAALGAGRLPGARRVVDAAVFISLALNLLPVGAALGIYRLGLAPYLPQLPLELYAVTSAAACWQASRRRRLCRHEVAAITASIMLALVLAALLEIWAVPHR